LSYSTTSDEYTSGAPLLRHARRGQCDVCRLVDGDTGSKLVEYCNICKAWICDACRKNWPRRMQAFFRARKAS
jgi:hypothetical protein